MSSFIFFPAHTTLVFLFLCNGSWANGSNKSRSATESLIADQYSRSVSLLLKNLPEDPAQQGAVLASPTTQYRFHWTRDAALTWDSLRRVYQQSTGKTREQLFEKFQSWVAFERKAVQNAVSAGLSRGEPKFYPDARPYTGDWGRPQDDGPALRSLVMSEWALQLLSQGERSFVLRELYRPELPADSIIKSDLEYTASHWNHHSFDPWEEIKGLNFYSLAVKRKALLVGARLASALGDDGAAEFYLSRARDILKTLELFTDAPRGYVISTINQTDGWNHKTSLLDAAVILGIIHGPQDSEYMKSQGLAVERTFQELAQRFRSLYPINQGEITPLIGRYPEDVYDGFGFSGGNPWFLTTHAFGEFLCTNGHTTSPSQSEYFLNEGRSYLIRTLRHRDQSTGEMSEQMSRFNGYLTGVSHLTWSYASFITAVHSCYPEFSARGQPL